MKLTGHISNDPPANPGKQPKSSGSGCVSCGKKGQAKKDDAPPDDKKTPPADPDTYPFGSAKWAEGGLDDFGNLEVRALSLSGGVSNRKNHGVGGDLSGPVVNLKPLTPGTAGIELKFATGQVHYRSGSEKDPSGRGGLRASGPGAVFQGTFLLPGMDKRRLGIGLGVDIGASFANVAGWATKNIKLPDGGQLTLGGSLSGGPGLGLQGGLSGYKDVQRDNLGSFHLEGGIGLKLVGFGFHFIYTPPGGQNPLMNDPTKAPRVGPKTVGPKRVGPKIVGPKIVGPPKRG
jgi:hypothetical protein